jgi:hypothetical protein
VKVSVKSFFAEHATALKQFLSTVTVSFGLALHNAHPDDQFTMRSADETAPVRQHKQA